MKFICRRCDKLIKHTRYRVTTEEDGVVLLNMLVCASCARIAKGLGLPVVRLAPANRTVKKDKVARPVRSKRQAVQTPL